MHERSLAQAILQEAAAVRRQRGLGVLRRVTIELGEFSGVESALLRSAFEDLSQEWLGDHAELEVHPGLLEAECQHCRRVFRVLEFQFRCPSCQGTDVQITRGEELRLISVTAETAEVCP